MKPHTMKSWQIDTLIAWFMFHLTMDLRRELMRDLPQIYNAVVGREIMVAVRVEDFDRLGKSVVHLTEKDELMRQENNDLAAERDALLKEKSELERQVDYVDAQREKDAAEIDRLEERAYTISQRREEAEARIAEMSVEMSELQDDVHKLADKRDELEGRIAELEARLVAQAEIEEVPSVG